MNNILKQLLFVTTSLYLFTSCITTNKLVGEYEYIVPNYFNCILILKKDLTFKYEIKDKKTNFRTEGIWTHINNRIVLNSFDQPPNNRIEVEEQVLDTNATIINISTFYDEPLSFGELMLNSDPDLLFVIDSEGVVCINKQLKVRSLLVYFITERYYYAVKDEKSNYLNVQVDFVLNPLKRLFTNDIWIYKEDKLCRGSCKDHNCIFWIKKN